ncbi:DNA topoisomerase 3-alpha-like [Ylistrum balloti]|uniref:DNA topoisomerase 3-alpha-like n=1 Tax=Ylistrum balloti TaxID=509963 RepID=UPI002905A593|nr:DNA topoisomerase 3-alpha-like [Ylistrum balloti]
MLVTIFRAFCTSSTEKMVKILNVAEKNDAAKSIAAVMSRGSARKREGFSKFNKIYEYEYNILNHNNCTMTMTSVSGHLLGLDFVGNYKKWYSCNPVALFDVEVEKYCPQNFTDIKRTLEREVRGAHSLIIWTDGDREGENIGFEIIQVCRSVKPNIPIYRAKFSEITPQAIQRACRNLVEPDKNTSDAVDVRQELDLRIGAAFTRFQTLRLQKIFPEVLSDQLISYGSCQFPTLGFVVERYKQVQAFVPEPFWKIKVTHKQEESTIEFNWKRVRLFDNTACLVLYEHCTENPTATVKDVKCKSKSKWRPQPLDTVELEKLASRKLRINAKETMKIAEKLYTEGYISYPRTETNKFPSDLDLGRLVEQQTVDGDWGDFARRVLEQGPQPRNGKKTDQAHPPIHPTKYCDRLQGNEKRVYEFIVRHFLATCSRDAQGQETVVEIDIADEKFSAQGLMITARNYLDVYPYERWNAKVIPVYSQGDSFQPNSIEMIESETSAPSLLSEADLIALMDKHGIGTDATHAEHIETIKSRMYVGLQGDNRFIPGHLGMGLVEGYDAMGYEMSKPHLRAELEADLTRICAGQKDKNVVLEEQKQKYKQVFIEACRQALKIDEALAKYLGEAQPLPAEHALETLASSPIKKCPNCGQDMMLKTKKDGKGFYIGCMGYPDCRNAVWLPDFVLEATAENTFCHTCDGVRLIKFKFKRGSVPPMVPTEYCGCIGGCDDILIEALNLNRSMGSSQRPTSFSNQSNLSDSGIGSTYSSDCSGRTSNGPTQATQNQRRQTTSLSNGSNNRQNKSKTTSQRQSYNNTNNTQEGYGNQGGRVPLVSVSPFNRNAPTGDGNAIVCSCGEDALLLTVRKEGPNTGRQFYKCGSSKCNFFLWADETPNDDDGGGGHSLYNRSTSTPYRGNPPPPAANTEDNKCNCGNLPKKLSVQKEGPNKGRQFLACNKPRGEGCNFFQWVDESGSSENTGGMWNKGGDSKRHGGSNSGGPTTKKARKCGLCGEEGHTRKTCPHK